MNAEIDMSAVTLKTERLILRPFTRGDLDDFYAYARVDGVGQMAGWIPHRDREESSRVLDMFIDGKKTLALERDGRVIGSLGVERYREENWPELNELQARELGFVLARDQWGQGLMPEAVRRLQEYLFTELKLDALTCGYFDWNHQSQRVQEKCSFHFVKAVPYVTRTGKEETCRCNILWRAEWEARHASTGGASL